MYVISRIFGLVCPTDREGGARNDEVKFYYGRRRRDGIMESWVKVPEEAVLFVDRRSAEDMVYLLERLGATRYVVEEVP